MNQDRTVPETTPEPTAKFFHETINAYFRRVEAYADVVSSDEQFADGTLCELLEAIPEPKWRLA